MVVSGLKGALSSHFRPTCSIILRTSENPFECTPFEARPIILSLALRFGFGNSSLRSTAPTEKPARSYSPSAYMPGISAVSPPIRAQPA